MSRSMLTRQETKSRDATSQGSINLNWLLFIADHQSPGFKPKILQVPLESFKAPSQLCLKLFAEAIKDRFELIVKESSIEFWKPRQAVLVKDYSQAVEKISTSGMNNDFEEILAPFSFSEELDKATLIKTNLHLFVTAQVGEARHDEEQDAITGLSAFQRYRNILAKPGPSPSEGSKSIQYARLQARKSYAIYDGRLPQTPTFGTVAPPIQIFHPIFDTFLQYIEDPSTHPKQELLRLTQEFMRFLSVISLSETERNDEIRKHLTKILGFNVHEEPNTDKSIADGVHIHVVDYVRVALLIMEFKRELGDGGSDPSTQAGLMMKRSWIQANRASIRDKCCCPTLILAGGGPWMAVLGGVFTDKIIVQRLTDFLWVGNSSTHEDIRVYHFAKVLNALRKCTGHLKAYYDLINSKGQPLEKSKEAHPRFFPHPTTFTIEKTQVISFQYLSAMEENEPTCVTFKAKILPGNSLSGHVVVKFVSRYSAEVHEFLAGKGHAPNLLYIGPLPDVPKRSPAQDVAPYGLSLGPMQMVVMEYVEASGSTPANARTQLEAVLTALHAHGYVFGDLRRPNILFDEEGAVKLIDFDWAGRYDRNIQDDLDLSEKLHQTLHISDNEHQQGNYAYYPLNLSPSVDWAEGVKDLKPIRPAHDWDMLKKLKL